MNNEEIITFVRNYAPDSRSRICFAWNQKHAADFVDENDLFRQQVIKAVIADPDEVSLELVGHLFEAEAKWSKEAWCVRDSFSTLGGILLNRGGIEQLDCFFEWFTLSFDSYSQCHAMLLDSEVLDSLISEVERRFADAKGDKEKAMLELAQQLFAKHKSGDPLKGMVKLHPSHLGRAKALSLSGWRGLISKIKRAFDKRYIIRK